MLSQHRFDGYTRFRTKIGTWIWPATRMAGLNAVSIFPLAILVADHGTTLSIRHSSCASGMWRLINARFLWFKTPTNIITKRVSAVRPSWWWWSQNYQDTIFTARFLVMLNIGKRSNDLYTSRWSAVHWVLRGLLNKASAIKSLWCRVLKKLSLFPRTY